jgi:hypothetical protein
MARPVADRVAHAALHGAATAIRDALRHNRDPDLVQRRRAEWPVLSEWIDAVVWSALSQG